MMDKRVSLNRIDNQKEKRKVNRQEIRKRKGGMSVDCHFPGERKDEALYKQYNFE